MRPSQESWDHHLIEFPIDRLRKPQKHQLRYQAHRDRYPGRLHHSPTLHHVVLVLVQEDSLILHFQPDSKPASNSPFTLLDDQGGTLDVQARVLREFQQKPVLPDLVHFQHITHHQPLLNRSRTSQNGYLAGHFPGF